MTDAAKPTWSQVFRALKRRKSMAMLALGFAAGLPYVLITGTLLAWFSKEGVDVKTIGVFSWVTIILGFKFLWAPAIDRMPTPRVFDMNQRRAGILMLQAFIIAMLAVISFASPQTQLGWIAVAAVACTFAFSSQDVLIDAWRIEVADEETTIDLLSSVYQVGYRMATILGGAGALIIAARIGWNNTFVALAGMMALAVTGVFVAENSPIRRQNAIEADEESIPLRRRNIVLIIVLAAWAGSFYAIFSFMGFALSTPDAANARTFTRETGPIIVFASVIAPVIAAAVMLRWRGAKPAPGETTPWRGQSALNILYGAILAPMIDLVKRLRYAALLVLTVALSYRFVDLIWGAFAYPFYLGENFGALGHTLDEVAIASKIFGTLMTFLGITVGAAAIMRFGRMPSLFVGGVMAAATNLLFADLAAGGAYTDSFMTATGLYGAFSIFQPLANFLSLDVNMNESLARLMICIAAENLAVGFASAAIVVYLSSVVNPKFAAVQYALLASLSMLIGSLGRGALGELIEERGFAYVFILTALMGLIAVVATGAEWARQARVARADAQPAPA